MGNGRPDPDRPDPDRPFKLSVYVRYTRRGGLDINPFRTSYPRGLPANIRTARQ